MIFVEPTVRLVSCPSLDLDEVASYLEDVDGGQWLDRVDPLFESGDLSDAEGLVEFAGRLCYRSWAPGLNPNVTRVRSDSAAYLENILASLHGSVTEHAYFVFVFGNVSRVFTHELVRHRVGTSISQESQRYVRLDSLPMWMPDWARDDAELMAKANETIANLEAFQGWMSTHFDLDSSSDFSYKKHRTSFMRRFAPEGTATTIVWGANIRTLRHVLELRTSVHAEEEIRKVFNEVGLIVSERIPHLFSDFEVNADGEWKPKYSKV